MGKLTHLFKQKTLDEFLRVFISDGTISLIHIRNNKIVHKNEFDFMSKMQVYERINSCAKLPLEIIISNKTISCRSIILDSLCKKDIDALAKNIFCETRNGVNFALYEKKFSYRNGTALFCDMKLSPVVSQILQEIISIGNPVNTIIASPFWVVTNYFREHPSERGKFKAQIFIVTTSVWQEVIALHNDKYVFYRKSTISNFDENNEVSDVIKYIKRLFTVNLDDIAIYSFDNETLDTFTTSSDINMQIISSLDDFVITRNRQVLNRAQHLICLLIMSLCFIKTFIDIGQIVRYKKEILKMNDTLNTFDSQILDDIDIWTNLSSQTGLTYINFRNKFVEKMRDIDKKLQNVSIEVNQKNEQVIFKPVYDEK